jgi:CPA1 family monovalent cation:H+ antiporter
MAALERLGELEGEEWVLDDTAGRLRGLYDFRVRRYGERFDDGSDGSNEARSLSYQRLRRELLDAERAAVLQLRREGVVSDDVMNRVLRDIALEDVRLDFER